ncbi:anthranilate phosphoribosyltransferase [Candidatus Omnitrophota bacterium]
MIENIIEKLTQKNDLAAQEIQSVFHQIMSGKLSKDEIVAFLIALRDKGETPEEIAAAAGVMREFSTKIENVKGIAVDTCGTGGDKSNTFNISTVSAFVVAGAGLKVAKHGNRSVSSKCGSADLLEALGVNISASAETVAKCINEIGIGFLFARNFHPAMKHAAPARKEISTRTIFNILGPLTNPADTKHQLLGVYDGNLLVAIATALKNLGLTHAMVVHGLDGLDEVTTTAATSVCELKNDQIQSYEVFPENFGIKRALMEDLKGADVEDNVAIANEILEGKESAKRDIVVLNAGCALYVGDKAKDIKEGVELAQQSIDSGNAKKKLELLRDLTQKN